MKIGLVPVNIGNTNPDSLIAIAQHAEHNGIESLWTFEHVIVPLDYQSKYPYNDSGKMGVTPETPLLDPLIALTLIAAHTQRVQLATGVNILSQANPLFLAKQAATLDVLSKGRFILGVGIGWLREEFDAMGVPFERRGARFDDYVVAMKKVWSGAVVEHKSDFLRWSGFKSYPLPYQRTHVPIVMGGSKGRIFERIAQHGDGWFAPTGSPNELTKALEQLRQACARIGRDPKTVEITAMLPPQSTKEQAQRLLDAGAHRLVTMALGNPMDDIKRIADQLIA